MVVDHNLGARPDHKRPTWDEYFMEMAIVASKRCSCGRADVGAVLVVDNHSIATGYAGAPSGLPTCDEVGHLMKRVYDERGGYQDHCIRTTHAEANAIAQAAKYGLACSGGTIYCTLEPCFDCAKLLINAGIKRVVALLPYHGAHDSRVELKKAGVVLEVLHP